MFDEKMGMPNPQELVGQSISQTELARKEKEEERDEKSLKFGEIMYRINTGCNSLENSWDPNRVNPNKVVEESTDKMRELLDSEDIEKTSEWSKEYCRKLGSICKSSLDYDEYEQSKKMIKELEKFGEFGFDKKNEMQNVTEQAIESLGSIAGYGFSQHAEYHRAHPGSIDLGLEALNSMKNLSKGSVENNFENASKKAMSAFEQIGIDTLKGLDYVYDYSEDEMSYINKTIKEMVNNIIELGKKGVSEQAVVSLQSLEKSTNRKIVDLNNEGYKHEKIGELKKVKDRIAKAIESLEEFKQKE